MSHKVLAWTFNPEAFHRWLVPRIVRDGKLDVAALASTAADVASYRAPIAMEYLEGLRIHPDDPESWEPLFELDPNVDSRDELYAIAMAGHLRSAADVSFWSHDLARVVLKRLGWEGDPSVLWLGHGLATLAGTSGDSALAAAISTARRSLGGWLSVHQAEKYLEFLLSFGAKPLPPDMRSWFEGTTHAALAPEELGERVEGALSELTAMASDAVDRGEALRLVYWS
ncbi:MAG: hypothetical protein ACRD2W_08325 [Acidimicrobiales bacterium]